MSADQKKLKASSCSWRCESGVWAMLFDEEVKLGTLTGMGRPWGMRSPVRSLRCPATALIKNVISRPDVQKLRTFLQQLHRRLLWCCSSKALHYSKFTLKIAISAETSPAFSPAPLLKKQVLKYTVGEFCPSTELFHCDTGRKVSQHRRWWWCNIVT